MIGNLTIDKASMNISYFLYSVKLVHDNGGRISRKAFVEKMADFMHTYAVKDGKENRTPYNKSKLPRYFGFIDIEVGNDEKDYLVLTNRGYKIIDFIAEHKDVEPKDRFYLLPECCSKFIDLIFESVIFDSFGKNNCGAETSNTDVEPPKVVFKAIYALGKATAEEICYIMYSLNKGLFNSFEEAVAAVESKRRAFNYNYSAIMEEWGLTNIVNDCKIINIFTDDNILLLISEKDEEIGKTFYYLNPRLSQKHISQIKMISPFYKPLRLMVYTNGNYETLKSWVDEAVLGRVSDNGFVFQFDESELIGHKTDTGYVPGKLDKALLKALSNEKKNVFLVIKAESEETLLKHFGQYANLLEYNDSFISANHGWSVKSLEDSLAYGFVKKQFPKIARITRENEIRLPSNLQIIGVIMSDIENEKVNYTFERCLVDVEGENATDSNADQYKDILDKNVIGMHITNKNSALSAENPHICIGWSSLGDLSDISTKEALGSLYSTVYPERSVNAKAQDISQIWTFLGKINPGDYVVYFDGRFANIGRITSDYYFEELPVEQDADYTNNRKVEWIKAVAYNDLPRSVRSAGKSARSIFSLNEYKSAILALLNGEVIDITDEDVLVDDDAKQNIIRRSPRIYKDHPMNMILYGAPGTGKTYVTADYALAIIEHKDVSEISALDRDSVMEQYNELISQGRVVFTTFHQSYGYEDFIQGLRPDTSSGAMEFKPVDGVFKKIAYDAMHDTANDYVIIIDEINRANISKVFGELITLIEGDKRWGEKNAICITLPSGEPFAVPNNLYIIGTMNSADKSISLIDTALRRRFEFVEVTPDYSIVSDGGLRTVLQRLNKGLADELDSTDLLIGHAYFIDKKMEDLCGIMNRAIIPLLYEYFYDNAKKVKDLVKKAVDGMAFDVEDGKVGRIKLIKKD